MAWCACGLRSSPGFTQTVGSKIHGPGTSSTSRCRDLAAAIAVATGHGFGRDKVRWTRRKRGYLQGVDGVQAMGLDRRSSGEICGGVVRIYLHRPPISKGTLALGLAAAAKVKEKEGDEPWV